MRTLNVRLFACSFLACLGAASLAACTIKLDDQGKAAGRSNDDVQDVIVVGTNVTSSIYTTGDMGLTLVPKGADNGAILSNDLKVQVRITTPADTFTVNVGATSCTPKENLNQGLAVGVIIDDSGSMSMSDPKKSRKDATVSFIKTVGDKDEVLLTDYGLSGSSLRDLVCVQNGGASCTPPTEAGFTADKGILTAAAEQIKNGGGTPLYESCVQMVPIVSGVKDRRHAMLLLSDGRPNSQTQRDQCHNAAKAAGVPVFTVGLGPAAEGDPQVDVTAVTVLRELATATGGAYASANDPAQLDKLFVNMGTALAQGSCQTSTKINEIAKLAPGMKIGGEVTVGNKGAKGTFEFITPAR